MTKKESIVKSLLSSDIFNKREIERKAGLRKYLTYEYIKGKAKLTPEQVESVFNILKNANKL